MDLHYSEDEQLEKLKSWWKKNGSSVLYGGALGLAIVLGYNYWISSTQTQSELASGLYEQMFVKYGEEDIKESQAVGGKIMKDFASTPYAAKAAMFLAKVSVEQDDLESAYHQLQWVIDNADETASRHAARLKMASLLISEDKLDQALILLDIKEPLGFLSHYREMQGDIYLRKQDLKSAHQAYQEALDSLPEGSNYRDLLKLKVDNSAVGEE